jgi:hypothetical protein
MQLYFASKAVRNMINVLWYENTENKVCVLWITMRACIIAYVHYTRYGYKLSARS